MMSCCYRENQYPQQAFEFSQNTFSLQQNPLPISIPISLNTSNQSSYISPYDPDLKYNISTSQHLKQSEFDPSCPTNQAVSSQTTCSLTVTMRENDASCFSHKKQRNKNHNVIWSKLKRRGTYHLATNRFMCKNE